MWPLLESKDNSQQLSVFSQNIPVAGHGTVKDILRSDCFGCIYLLLTLVSAYFCFSRWLIDLLVPFHEMQNIAQMIWGLTCLISISAFIFSERKSQYPIFALDHFRVKAVLPILLIIFLSSMIHQAVLYNAPLYAIIIDHASAATAGIYILPVSIAAVFATLLSGLRISVTGRYKSILILGALCVSLGPSIFLVVSLMDPEAFGYTFMEICGSFLSSFGYQVVNSVSTVVILTHCNQGNVATLTSHSTCNVSFFIGNPHLDLHLSTVIKSLGGVFGTAISSFLIDGPRSAQGLRIVRFIYLNTRSCG